MTTASNLRPDLAAIAEMIPDGARVLDVGCGDGSLLEYLVRTKHVDGRGIELSQQNVNACVARGLAVVQGDADTDLAEYPGQVFDFAILSQTIQATEKPAPNIHLCTVADFVDLARTSGAVIDRALALKSNGVAGEMRTDSWGPNFMAQGAIFLLRKS